MLRGGGMCIYLSMGGISVGFSLVGEGVKVCRHPVDTLLRLIV